MSSRDVIQRMLSGSERVREAMWANAIRPEGRKELDLAFGLREAAELVDRSESALKLAEAEGRIPKARTKPNGRRFYTVDDLVEIRQRLGVGRSRAPDEEPLIIGVQNFKGGVAKTTITVHLAHYLGLRGYRVLVIDCDSQASTTSMFDIVPDMDLAEEETIGAVLSPRFPHVTLKSIIRKTHWPTIHIAPANLDVQNAEYELTAASRAGGGFKESIGILRREIEAVIDSYDVVLIDPPPAMGYLALNTICAAKALLIPVPARNLDFVSTLNYLQMTDSIIETLTAAGIAIDHKFIRVMCSAFSPEKAADREMLTAMKAAYGAQLIGNPILLSDEIKHAAGEYRSVYEVRQAIGARSTHERCKANLDAVFKEIETIIRQQWPSHAKALAKQGLVSAAEAA